MKKNLVIVLGSLAGLAILYFVVGPNFIRWTLAHAPVAVPRKTAPVRIKASGTLSLVDNHIVLTTPHGKNNYILVGEKEKSLKPLADAKQSAFVFGQLMPADPKKVGDTPIRYRIDVAQFDTKDFEIAPKVSPEVAEAIRRKVEEKIAFREATLKKLKVSDKNMEVLSGKLALLDGCIYNTDPQEHLGVMLQDKYGDDYFLLNGGALKKPYNSYAKIAGAGMDVVVVGRVSLMDPGITTALSPSISYVPFVTLKIYNADLTELVLDNGK